MDDELLIGPRTDTPHALSSWILAPGFFPSHGIGAMGTTLRRVILRAVGFEHVHEDEHEDDFEPASEALQPRGREVQFGQGAILRYSSTPTLWGGFDFADRCQSWVSVPKGQQD